MSHAPTRKNRSWRALWVLPAALVAAAAFMDPASGHHAFAAEFDATKALDLSGKVTRVRWVNPHSWLYFDVVDESGAVTNWGVEFSTPNGLARLGLTKADVAAGTQVRVQGYRSKNGGPYGYSVNVTLADGRSFQTGSRQEAPAAAESVGAR